MTSALYDEVVTLDTAPKLHVVRHVPVPSIPETGPPACSAFRCGTCTPRCGASVCSKFRRNAMDSEQLTAPRG